MINLPSGHHICFLAENQASPHISWLQSYEIKKKKKKRSLSVTSMKKMGYLVTLVATTWSLGAQSLESCSAQDY